MRICLFGAGSNNINQRFINIGYQLGQCIAYNNHTLVFGGGNDGMMGAVARGVYDNQGQIIGIVPEWMTEFEDLFDKCDECIYTESMAERKYEFIDKSDIFIIAPGGIGTLDEFFEVITLKKLKYHDKRILIFNIDNFFDKMLDMLENMVFEGFIHKEDFDNIEVTDNVKDTIRLLA